MSSYHYQSGQLVAVMYFYELIIIFIISIFMIRIYIPYSYNTKIYIQNNYRHSLDLAHAVA
jgi:hypothetical protein